MAVHAAARLCHERQAAACVPMTAPVEQRAHGGTRTLYQGRYGAPAGAFDKIRNVSARGGSWCEVLASKKALSAERARVSAWTPPRSYL
jgi:hypothetical protein